MSEVVEKIERMFEEYEEEEIAEKVSTAVKKLVKKAIVSMLKANAPLTVQNLIIEMHRHYIVGNIELGDDRIDKLLGLTLGRFGVKEDMLVFGGDKAILMLHKATEDILAVAVDFLAELSMKMLDEYGEEVEKEIE